MPDRTTGPLEGLLTQLSRELALVCDVDGKIIWADDRAKSLIRAEEGQLLSSYVAPGFEAAAEELVKTATRDTVESAELALVVANVPTQVSFRGAPQDGGALLLGTLLPQKVSAELKRVNTELTDSVRGLNTLYQELNDKAESLRRAGDVKSRVVSNVSHEFRTPLNSITGLARLLLSRVDGALTSEQEKQVNFILKSADELALLVNDLLDLNRLESGKTQLRPVRFSAESLFGALRGMMRPLHTNSKVTLTFDAQEKLPDLHTDESKISQILRNLIQNALKFTKQGEVRVTARSVDDKRVAFEVSDTGIGIAPEDHPRVFEEFTQLQNEQQKEVKGSGLGLALSRRLAEFLGGTLGLKSELGKGATFTLTVPAVHPEVEQMEELNKKAAELDPFKSPVLVVEDDRQTMFLYEKYLRGSGFQVIPARSVEDARAALLRIRPAAVVLDVMLEGETTWAFLNDLKRDPDTRDIPVLVVTVTDREQKARALGADEFWLKPMDQNWLLKKLRGLARHGPVERILVIDDDEVSRYLVRRLLADTQYSLVEAGGGKDGIRMAREQQPQLILLDFVLPDMSAFDVIDDLKTHPSTRGIPVIVHTSRSLDDDERRRLASDTAAVLQKQSLSRELALGRIRDALVKAGVTPMPDRH